MRGVDRFDERGRLGCPLGDYTAVAAVAAGLVAELPAEDCRRGFVAVDDEGNVVLVGGLRCCVRVEGSCVAAEVVAYTPKSARDIHRFGKGEKKLEARLQSEFECVLTRKHRFQEL